MSHRQKSERGIRLRLRQPLAWAYALPGRRWLLGCAVGVGFLLVLAIAAWALCKYLKWPTPDWLEELGRDKALTVAQIVPAVVVAIFVFAVGTAFVVAQVVPPARGTRATSTLQGGRMAYSVAPAPALILGSVLAVLIPDRWAGATSVAILLGAFLYLLVSLWAMMNILFDATDPRRFKKLLLRKARRATQGQANYRPPSWKTLHSCAEPAVPALVDPKPPRGPGLNEVQQVPTCTGLSIECGDG